MDKKFHGNNRQSWFNDRKNILIIWIDHSFKGYVYSKFLEVYNSTIIVRNTEKYKSANWHSTEHL